MIEFGCRDRDSMGKVSGDLGFRDDLSPTIKGNFENYFSRVVCFGKFSDCHKLIGKIKNEK